MNSDITRWAETALGRPVRAAHKMDGSTSSTLYRMNTTKGDFVLRLFDNVEWLAEEPDLTRHEAAALNKAGETGLPCPEVVDFAEAGAVCDFPLLLMTHLAGVVDLKPVDFDDWLHQQAEALAVIHAIPAANFGWQYFPWGEVKGQAVPEWTPNPELWQRAIDIAEGPQPAYRECFLHRDYHPTNLLWEDGKISGVVDWVNACRGPAGVDLAHCRGNLVALYGVEAADRFLEHYHEEAGPSFVYDPYWDVIRIVADLTYATYPFEPYPPWLTFGVTHLTPNLLHSRLESYLASALARV